MLLLLIFFNLQKMNRKKTKTIKTLQTYTIFANSQHQKTKVYPVWLFIIPFSLKKNQWLFINSWSRSWYPIDCQYNAWFVSEGVNILFAQRLLSMAFPCNGIHVLWYKSIPIAKNYRLYHLYRSWLSFTAFLKEKKTFHVFHFICLNSI